MASLTPVFIELKRMRYKSLIFTLVVSLVMGVFSSAMADGTMPLPVMTQSQDPISAGACGGNPLACGAAIAKGLNAYYNEINQYITTQANPSLAGYVDKAFKADDPIIKKNQTAIQKNVTAINKLYGTSGLYCAIVTPNLPNTLTQLATLCPNGGVVKLAPGNYSVSTAFTIPSNVVLSGDGVDNTIINSSGATLPTLINMQANSGLNHLTLNAGNSGLTNLILYNGNTSAAKITLSNVSIEGNPSAADIGLNNSSSAPVSLYIDDVNSMPNSSANFIASSSAGNVAVTITNSSIYNDNVYSPAPVASNTLVTNSILGSDASFASGDKVYNSCFIKIANGTGFKTCSPTS